VDGYNSSAKKLTFEITGGLKSAIKERIEGKHFKTSVEGGPREVG